MEPDSRVDALAKSLKDSGLAATSDEALKKAEEILQEERQEKPIDALLKDALPEAEQTNQPEVKTLEEDILKTDKTVAELFEELEKQDMVRTKKEMQGRD